MQIAFGILSANEPAAAVRQLVDAVGADDPVLLHHDFSRQPDVAPALARSRAYLIPDYVETGWGRPGLVRAIFHLIRTALVRSRFDYFQLLSASCLPLWPIAMLKAGLARRRAAIHADLVNLDRDEAVMLSHGHRVFCRSGRLGARVLGRSRRWVLGERPVTVQQANLGVEQRRPDAGAAPLHWLGRQIHYAARAGLLDRHPFSGRTAPFVGSLWFCLRRDVCEYLVAREQDNPLLDYLLDLQVCDEIAFATLLGNSGFDVAASNHHVSDFVGAHPRLLTLADLPTVARSRRGFARKFSSVLDDPMRRAVLALQAGRVAALDGRLAAA